MGLAAATAHNWRLIRGKLALSGVTDPLRSFTTLHAVLDVMEALLVENQDEKGVNEVYTSLYRPEPGQKFDVADSDDSFDSFFAAVDGMQ